MHMVIMGRRIAEKAVLPYIREKWKGYGGGEIDIQVVRDEKGLDYLSKYLGKAKETEIKGVRVYSMSKGFRKKIRPESGGWEVVRIGKMNPDGSYGEVIWEKGDENIKKILDNITFEELMQFFKDEGIKLRPKQKELFRGGVKENGDR